jgi:hypothetical protein
MLTIEFQAKGKFFRRHVMNICGDRLIGLKRYESDTTRLFFQGALRVSLGQIRI